MNTLLLTFQLGAMDVESGTRGFVRFDDVEARRFSYIGALLPPGLDEGAPQGGQPGWIARGYAYDPARPHAVSGLTVSGEQTAAYEYDQNGNMTCRLEDGLLYTHTYNAENRIAAIQRMDGTDCAAQGQILESWLFTYDGDGLRTGQIHYSGQTAVENSLLFFGGTYEVRQDLAAAATTTKAYYAIAGQTIAVRTVSAAASTLHYILTDHLGSTSAILDETGTLTNQQRFLPFGQPRADVPTPFAAPTDFGFTGQRLLNPGLGGLMDYRARFYSPALGRFIQPDTLIPGAGDPQAWNRYSYVLNSPIRYNDPTGHGVDCGIGENCRFEHPKRIMPPNKDDTRRGESRDNRPYRYGFCVGDMWMKNCSWKKQPLVVFDFAGPHNGGPTTLQFDNAVSDRLGSANAEIHHTMDGIADFIFGKAVGVLDPIFPFNPISSPVMPSDFVADPAGTTGFVEEFQDVYIPSERVYGDGTLRIDYEFKSVPQFGDGRQYMEGTLTVHAVKLHPLHLRLFGEDAKVVFNWFTNNYGGWTNP